MKRKRYLTLLIILLCSVLFFQSFLLPLVANATGNDEIKINEGSLNEEIVTEEENVTAVESLESGQIANKEAEAPEGKGPELFTKDNSVLEFCEGERVTKEMLLENIYVYDQEDALAGKPLTIEDVRIVSIDYAAGKIVNGKKQPAYKEEWPLDVPEDFLLDTWPQQMDSDTSAVTHKITYEVTDHSANTTSFQWYINVNYNEYPEIKTKDYYFTLKEAQSGAITVNALLEDVRAWDMEDCEGHCLNENPDDNSCLESDISCGFAKERIMVLGFDSDKFKNLKQAGYENILLLAVDQYGKETQVSVRVHVIESDEIKDVSNDINVRFIDKDNYDKNSNLNIHTISEESIKQANENGGLIVGSKWYSDMEYRNLIEDVFKSKDTIQTENQWHFSAADVKWVKEYVKDRGIGNSKSDSGLRDFYHLIQTQRM